MPQQPHRERIAGTFYTVEDLMNLPEPEQVDPAKAREVSARLPIRQWLPTAFLIALLEDGIECLQNNLAQLSPDDPGADDCTILIEQRRLWLRHLGEGDAEELFVAFYPASTAGEAFDHEEAVRDDASDD
jgi:hypothetical protein